MVARCLSGISTGGSRDFSDGNGGTLKEYGYYRAASGTDLQGETVMLDAPFIYLGAVPTIGTNLLSSLLLLTLSMVT